jgi:quercetin dioxygenase-like cupin family protein
MHSIDEQQWINKLTSEGFRNVQVHSFGPGTIFPEHEHEARTTHIILKGLLTTTDESGVKIWEPGSRFDIQAGATHRAECGPEGCVFIAGEL